MTVSPCCVPPCFQLSRAGLLLHSGVRDLLLRFPDDPPGRDVQRQSEEGRALAYVGEVTAYGVLDKEPRLHPMLLPHEEISRLALLCTMFWAWVSRHRRSEGIQG